MERLCSLLCRYAQKQHVYSCSPNSVLELAEVSHVMAVRSSSDILSFFCMLQSSGKKFSTWSLSQDGKKKTWQEKGRSAGAALRRLLFTFSTCAFLIPAEAQQLSSYPLWVVELHTRCFWKKQEKLLRTRASPGGWGRLSKLTFVILIDGHGGWLQDATSVPLIHPKCDLFWFFVRNLQERPKTSPRETGQGSKLQHECVTLSR